MEDKKRSALILNTSETHGYGMYKVIHFCDSI